MERLTLEEAIKHANQVAMDKSSEMAEKIIGMIDVSSCKKCMEEHEQLAEWLEELKEYKGLEKQGKLLKLPCAVGDTMYTNTSMQGWHFKKKDRPYKVKVVFIGINGVDNCMHIAFDNGCMFQFWFSEIGKTIFLTKEAAEAALMEG